MLSVILAGVGGQGTVLLSRLIGAAAISYGLEVRGAETIGMAQRGGVVISHVRMGKDIASPLIPKSGADIIIAFEPGEAVRALPFLKEGGAMVVCDRAIMPVVKSDYSGEEMIAYLRENIQNLTVVNGDALIKSCGGKAVNVALLGASAANGLFPFGMETVENVINEMIPERYLEMNQNALKYGAALTRGRIAI